MLTVVHGRCGTRTPVPARQVAARARGVPIACVWCDGCGEAVRVAEVRWSDTAGGLEDQAIAGERDPMGRRPSG